MNEPPVRLCCMERHWTVECPDGKVMCCICFDRVTVADLSSSDGSPIDVCWTCGQSEGLDPPITPTTSGGES